MPASDASRPADAGGSGLLVVAAETVTGSEVVEAIAERAGGRGSRVLLIAPALAESALEHAMGDVDEAMAAARERLERSQAELAQAGIEAETRVGDGDLRLAIQDALQTFDADEIVIVAHAEGGPYHERQSIHEAERDFEPPITELFVERHGDEATVADVERKEAGQLDADPGEQEPESRNLPPFSPRDLLGIVVAIVGTIVLVILAASDTEALNSEGGGLSSQAARILIAGAMALVNIAHIVGLTLFQAGPYRGPARSLFSWVSLVGTPVAIIVSLLLI